MLPLRLRRVSGLEGRLNDVLFHPAASHVSLALTQTLVYFGGDVQDYPEVMQAHRDNRNYVKWNLENTARMLSQNFPNKHILVVRPSRTEYKSFSCYDNFVPSNNAGVPDHTPTHSALAHLQRLLQSVSARLKTLPPSELEAVSSVSLPEDIDIEDLHKVATQQGGEHDPSELPAPTAPTALTALTAPTAPTSPPAPGRAAAERKASAVAEPTPALEAGRLSLVGFSKGCVVLNQILYEFHYAHTLAPGDERTMRFVSRIEEMYWLDGGHAGGKNTWITARSLLETLARLDVNVFVHVSPYQVRDEGRPWIGREEKAFTALLRKLGARVSRYMHARSGAPLDLHMHFEVLANFKRVQDSAPPPAPAPAPATGHASDTSDEET